MSTFLICCVRHADKRPIVKFLCPDKITVYYSENNTKLEYVTK